MGSQGIVRAVFDTNIVVSALLFGSGRLSWLRTAWREGGVVPLVCKESADELVRVLRYPKFDLSETLRNELLGEFLPYAEVVTLKGVPELPVCRDPHDQKFLQLAAAAEADLLVTGDADLLVLADRFPIPIIAPVELSERLGLTSRRQ